MPGCRHKENAVKTFIYTERPSTKRGYNVRITVFRVKHNRPEIIGGGDFNTASWKGAHGEAVTIVHENARIPYAVNSDGSVNRYELRGELSPAFKYDEAGHPRDAVRVFEV